MDPRLAIVGLVVGLLIGISGVGSGSLTAPLLLFLGIDPATVVGSDLCFGLVTKSAGVGVYVRERRVRWRWVGLLATGSLPGAVAGSALVALLERHGDWIRAGIAAMLVVTSATALGLELWRRHAGALGAAGPRGEPPTAVVPLVGLAVGLVAGATSVGAGSLVDVALALCSPLGGAEIVGTGFAHGILLSTVASLVHWHAGTIAPALVLNLSLGSIPGVLLGGRLACRFPSRPLRRGILALVLIGGLTALTRSVSS